MFRPGDKKNTENALALDKNSYKYKKLIGYRLGRTINGLTLKKFHDVHNSMYRFLCVCEVCGEEGLYMATYLKNGVSKCKNCRGIPKEERDVNQNILPVTPPPGISDEDFEQAKYELREIDRQLYIIEKLCFEYANCKSMLGTDDGEDDRYYEARMTVALHDIVDVKNMILHMYGGHFPGFARRAQEEKVYDEVMQLSGINEELLGSAQ